MKRSYHLNKIEGFYGRRLRSSYFDIKGNKERDMFPASQFQSYPKILNIIWIYPDSTLNNPTIFLRPFHFRGPRFHRLLRSSPQSFNQVTFSRATKISVSSAQPLQTVLIWRWTKTKRREQTPCSGQRMGETISDVQKDVERLPSQKAAEDRLIDRSFPPTACFLSSPTMFLKVGRIRRDELLLGWKLDRRPLSSNDLILNLLNAQVNCSTQFWGNLKNYPRYAFYKILVKIFLPLIVKY